ncbi:MAG: LEA type 2 family protein [Candidatus Margulisbacteria bacterium]|jgi:LEA14-like dessication related protein|nr:LEA type 2 family protein [Candidatus Margulisiibacteriota bacterium]
MKKIILVAVGVLAAFALTGCVSLNPPQIDHQETNVTPLSFQELQATSKFSIKNSNPIALNGVIDYTLVVNGREFSTGRSSSIEVGATGQATFQIVSRIDLVKVFAVATDLANAIAAGKTSIPYELRGKFRSSVVGIGVEAPVAASGTLPLPKPTEVESLIRSLLK